ncbi:MAG TPA: hypothetical protein VHY19_09595 [Steroidobacteraceae bacterium]|jgi:hypothetical protein|nr:hypothetical protein [Steroidobacteraceae bacterium]
MSTQPNYLDERTVERLCSAYRAAVKDAPYGATDHVMLRAAARRLRTSWVRPTTYVAAVLLAATLGLTLMFAITAPNKKIQRTGTLGDITQYLLERDRHLAVALPRQLAPRDVAQSAQGLLQAVPNLPACAAQPCDRLATPPASSAPGKISRFLVKDLKDARAAMNARDYDREITSLREALAGRGQRSAFDDYLINSWLAAAYVNERNYAQAAPVLEAAAESQYAPPAARSGMLAAAVAIYSQLHQHYKAIEAAQIAIRLGAASPSLYVTMAVNEDQIGQYKEAAQAIQAIIDGEPKPEEKYLKFQWEEYTKAHDGADAARVADELCFYYRRPRYCRAH